MFDYITTQTHLYNAEELTRLGKILYEAAFIGISQQYPSIEEIISCKAQPITHMWNQHVKFREGSGDYIGKACIDLRSAHLYNSHWRSIYLSYEINECGREVKVEWYGDKFQVIVFRPRLATLQAISLEDFRKLGFIFEGNTHSPRGHKLTIDLLLEMFPGLNGVIRPEGTTTTNPNIERL